MEGLPERQDVWYILHEVSKEQKIGFPLKLGLARIQMVIQTAHLSAGLRKIEDA